MGGTTHRPAPRRGRVLCAAIEAPGDADGGGSRLAVPGGADLRGVFDAGTTTVRERKQLLRAVIDEVVITVDPPAGVAKGHIAWEGGATTAIEVTLPRRGDQAIRTDEETVEPVRRLAVHYDDATIARHLARQSRAAADRPGLHQGAGGAPAPDQGQSPGPPTRRLSHPPAMMRTWSASPRRRRLSGSPGRRSTAG